MKILLLPIAAPVLVAAMLMVPATASAEQCRAAATGKFAKCGTPGAVPAASYVAKGKTKSAKSAKMVMPMAAPMAAATPAKPGMMAGMMAKMKKPAPAATMPAKAARCKTAKGKFIKCGMPGAMPA